MSKGEVIARVAILLLKAFDDAIRLRDKPGVDALAEALKTLETSRERWFGGEPQPE